MKGFFGAFLVFTLWAAASIYYLSFKEDATMAIRNKADLPSPVITSISKNTDTQKSPKKRSAVAVPAVEAGEKVTKPIVDTSSVSSKDITETSSQFVDAQLLADEIKKTIAISDTIDIDSNEPTQTLEDAFEVASGPSVSTKTFYPQYNNADLVLDKELVNYATELKQLLKEHPEKKVTIIGYTDNVGNATDNFKIALRKSRQVKWYLTARRGIPRSKITAISRGEEEPIESNKNKWGRHKNNRIEIIID